MLLYYWKKYVEKDVKHKKLLTLYRHNFEQLVKIGKIYHPSRDELR